MKNLLEEEYVLSRMATGDFDQAKRSLLMVKRYKRPEVIIALIKDAIISYSRPFSSNRGGFRKKKLKIGNDVIPNDQRKFHNKILMIRNNLVAHTNLKYRNPKLVKVNEPP